MRFRYFWPSPQGEQLCLYDGSKGIYMCLYAACVYIFVLKKASNVCMYVCMYV